MREVHPSARLALLSFAALIVPEYLLSAAPSQAEYLGGTVKSIPSNTAGSLDLSDPKQLLFTSGKLVYRLPYERIRGVHFSARSKPRRTIARLPLPGRRSPDGSQTLDLSFRDPEGKRGSLSFRLMDDDSTVEWTLAERVEAYAKESGSANRSRLPESWWGDKYWKTTRNKGAWPQAASQTPVPADRGTRSEGGTQAASGAGDNGTTR